MSRVSLDTNVLSQVQDQSKYIQKEILQKEDLLKLEFLPSKAFPIPIFPLPTSRDMSAVWVGTCLLPNRNQNIKDHFKHPEDLNILINNAKVKYEADATHSTVSNITVGYLESQTIRQLIFVVKLTKAISNIVVNRVKLDQLVSDNFGFNVKFAKAKIPEKCFTSSSGITQQTFIMYHNTVHSYTSDLIAYKLNNDPQTNQFVDLAIIEAINKINKELKLKIGQYLSVALTEELVSSCYTSQDGELWTNDAPVRGIDFQILEIHLQSSIIQFINATVNQYMMNMKKNPLTLGMILLYKNEMTSEFVSWEQVMKVFGLYCFKDFKQLIYDTYIKLYMPSMSMTMHPVMAVPWQKWDNVSTKWELLQEKFLTLFNTPAVVQIFQIMKLFVITSLQDKLTKRCCLWLAGDSNSGKSTLQNWISAMFKACKLPNMSSGKPEFLSTFGATGNIYNSPIIMADEIVTSILSPVTEDNKPNPIATTSWAKFNDYVDPFTPSYVDQKNAKAQAFGYMQTWLICSQQFPHILKEKMRFLSPTMVGVRNRLMMMETKVFEFDKMEPTTIEAFLTLIYVFVTNLLMTNKEYMVEHTYQTIHIDTRVLVERLMEENPHIVKYIDQILQGSYDEGNFFYDTPAEKCTSIPIDKKAPLQEHFTPAKPTSQYQKSVESAKKATPTMLGNVQFNSSNKDEEIKVPNEVNAQQFATASAALLNFDQYSGNSANESGSKYDLDMQNLPEDSIECNAEYEEACKIMGPAQVKIQKELQREYEYALANNISPVKDQYDAIADVCQDAMEFAGLKKRINPIDIHAQLHEINSNVEEIQYLHNRKVNRKRQRVIGEVEETESMDMSEWEEIYNQAAAQAPVAQAPAAQQARPSVEELEQQVPHDLQDDEPAEERKE